MNELLGLNVGSCWLLPFSNSIAPLVSENQPIVANGTKIFFLLLLSRCHSKDESRRSENLQIHVT
jgi:hypothetical protein